MKSKTLIFSVLLLLVMIGSLRAEQLLSVKYRDDYVDVSGFLHQDTGESSWITGIWYDEENDYLIIGLNGINYQYCGVPVDVWEDIIDYDKHGSYGRAYNQYLKGSYSCQE